MMNQNSITKNTDTIELAIYMKESQNQYINIFQRLYTEIL